jgi:large subunit ribosomal protein L25
MAQVALSSKFRNDTGKGVARKLRAVGQIPGVLYGPTISPIHLALDHKEVLSLIQSKGLNRILELSVDGAPGESKHLCLIKDVQRDVYQTKVLHIDLRRIDLAEKVVVSVRVSLEGEAAIRAKGGIVEQMVRGVKVRTTPGNIPAGLTADISGLHLGQTITVGQLSLPADVELVGNPDQPIVNVFATRGSAMTKG